MMRANGDGHRHGEQQRRVEKDYRAKLPTWRQPLFGYVAVLPLFFVAVLITLSIWQMRTYLILPGAFFSVILMLIALLWGIGPTILMLILALGCIDYLFIAPRENWIPASWLDTLQLGFCGVAGLLLIAITLQRERARMKAFVADELEALNQAKDHFLSIASHELKTPVTAIRAQAQLALQRLLKQKEEGLKTEQLLQSLQAIDEQTGRLTTLMNDLLDVNRIQTGQVPLKRQPSHLNEICQKVVEQQSLLSERRIILDTPAFPIEIAGDGDRLMQALTNVLSNAIKYSPQERPVEVSVSQNTEHARVQVRDYGAGISKEHLPHIFETFYRTPDVQASSVRGFGLGLAIAKEIVELHKGRIWCESEPDQGSTFFLELPLKWEDAPLASSRRSRWESLRCRRHG